MIRIISRREQETPPKGTQFALHGKLVDRSRIKRFTRRPARMIIPVKDVEASPGERKYIDMIKRPVALQCEIMRYRDPSRIVVLDSTWLPVWSSEESGFSNARRLRSSRRA